MISNMSCSLYKYIRDYFIGICKYFRIAWITHSFKGYISNAKVMATLILIFDRVHADFCLSVRASAHKNGLRYWHSNITSLAPAQYYDTYLFWMSWNSIQPFLSYDSWRTGGHCQTYIHLKRVIRHSVPQGQVIPKWRVRSGPKSNLSEI